MEKLSDFIMQSIVGFYTVYVDFIRLNFAPLTFMGCLDEWKIREEGKCEWKIKIFSTFTCLNFGKEENKRGEEISKENVKWDP